MHCNAGVPWTCFGGKNKRYWKLDCGDVCHQSSATLSRWRQSPGSPTAPSHLTPHLYWNLNDTICALPRRKVWIWHFEFTFCIWKVVVGFVGASPSQDQYWSVNDTIWELWKAPAWREDNKAEIILQLTHKNYQTRHSIYPLKMNIHLVAFFRLFSTVPFKWVIEKQVG